jgi:hypothetical protein
MLRSSHPNAEVRELFREHIGGLLRDIERMEAIKDDLQTVQEEAFGDREARDRARIDSNIRRRRRIVSAPPRERLQQLRELLREVEGLLVDVMEGRQDLGTFTLVKRLYRLGVIRGYRYPDLEHDDIPPDYEIDTYASHTFQQYLIGVIASEVGRHDIRGMIEQASEVDQWLTSKAEPEYGPYIRTISIVQAYLRYLTDDGPFEITLAEAMRLGLENQMPNFKEFRTVMTNSAYNYVHGAWFAGTMPHPEVSLEAALAMQYEQVANKQFPVRISAQQKAQARELLVQRLTRADSEAEARAQYAVVITFAVGLNRLCELLREEPVEVVSGPKEPERTIIDLREERAEELKALPNFQAWYRTPTGQREIDVLPGWTSIPVREERVAIVRSRSKERFGVPLTLARSDLSAAPESESDGGSPRAAGEKYADITARSPAESREKPPIGRRSRRRASS